MLLFASLVVRLLPVPAITGSHSSWYPRMYDSCLTVVVRWHRRRLAELIFEYPLEEVDRAITSLEVGDAEERHLSFT